MTVPGEPKPMRRRWLRWLLWGVGALVGWWVVTAVAAFITSIPWALDTSVASSCEDHLRAIGEAMEAYSIEWSGRLPPADRWCDALYPKYLKSNSSFACKRARGEYGYAMNSKLSGAKLRGIENVDRVPLVFETTKARRNANDPVTSRRRDGPHRVPASERRGSGVLFADLAARIVPDDEELSP
jgi:hypothetical protein